VIYVQRAPAPASLNSKQAERACAAVEEFYEQSPKRRLQERYEFDQTVYDADDVREGLWVSFHGKCAYCESSVGIDASNMLLEHFRPHSGAVGLDGTYDLDHYWWLAYEWENLLPACPDCMRSKGNRFPVGAQRARPHSHGEALTSELPRLLDPCVSDPAAHLVYGEDGYLSSNTEAGRTTIEVLALNRAQLIEARRQVLLVTRAALERLDPFQPEQIVALGDPARPYAGIRRQFTSSWFAEQGLATVQQLGELLGAPVVNEQQREATRSVFADFEKRMREYTVVPHQTDPDPSSDAAYYITARTISRIEIRNFKILKHLDLEFPEPDGTGTPWLMLLGENGLGKSSVLQAVALALMGSDYRSSLGVDARQMVSWGAREGSVRIHLTGNEPIELRFSNRSPEFESTPQEPQVLLMAYGATRLLPRLGGAATGPVFGPARGTRFANVDNLFDPFTALSEPRTWLLELDEEHFQTVARCLKELFPLRGIEQFERQPGGLYVHVFGQTLTLEQLSDGYQSVLALATDMMQVLLHRWPAVEIAEGIVVIDELEAHLHPSWRMRIVKSLKQVFPRLQFLATTHDPLCLRGLEDGEAMVVRRNAENDIFLLEDLPSIKGLRVDQLLTSEIFGLDSTSDPEVDDLLDEYRQLRWQQPADPATRARAEEVRERLEELQLLGHNTRERLMLEAVDEYLARERTLAVSEQRIELKDATKLRIAEILRAGSPPSEPER
jgi:uncharacterized protein (TIGR02646 family)